MPVSDPGCSSGRHGFLGHILLSGVISPKGTWSFQGVPTMTVIAIGIMWAFAFAVFSVITWWPMGKTSNQRADYWAKYEGK